MGAEMFQLSGGEKNQLMLQAGTEHFTLKAEYFSKWPKTGT